MGVCRNVSASSLERIPPNGFSSAFRSVGPSSSINRRLREVLSTIRIFGLATLLVIAVSLFGEIRSFIKSDLSPIRLVTVRGRGRSVSLGKVDGTIACEWTLGTDNGGAEDRRLRGGVGNSDFREGMV